ncbi:MAG: TIGR03067 domain-containing protein [Thermomonas sp.]
MTRQLAIRLLASLLFPLSLSASASTTQNSYKSELQAMAGTWLPVSAENNGYKATAQDLQGAVWKRDRDGNWTMWREGKAVVSWAVKGIDAEKIPKWIDIEVMDGSYKGVVYKGIYELGRDTLRICFALPDKGIRPSTFSAARGTINACSEFRRVH